LSRILQAGAIAFKIADDNAIRILIVRAKKTPADWIFPKGHIEEGETAEDAARRELEEEAGVSGESLGLVGSLDFQSGKEMVTCEYYLVRFDHDVPRKEKREIRWCEYDEALTLLTHREAAELLKKALPVIESHRS
jgi:8-oxo-dGTP pyrophosphatase MutT (NUDIX family)